MTTKKCPFCGNLTLDEKHGEFSFEPPKGFPGGTMTIPDAIWFACKTCGEAILPPALDKAIDAERYKRQGLLAPTEVRDARMKTGLSAVDMAQLLGVGEKTYTRWETGRSIQNKSNDTLIRLLEENADVFALVEAERQPDRPALIARYFANLKDFKGNHPLAMAAHGGDLGEAATETLRRRLKEIIGTQKGAT